MNPTNFANANETLSNIRPLACRFGWILMTVYLLAVYLLLNFGIPGKVSGNLNLYIFQPAVWLTIAFLGLWLWSVEGESLNLFEHRNLILAAILVGGLQVAGSILLGFLSGFGHSPYAHTFLM